MERWPEGKEALNTDWETPLSTFEKTCVRFRSFLSDEGKEKIIALLGGPYPEANND
jgi:hypothetical protein